MPFFFSALRRAVVFLCCLWPVFLLPSVAGAEVHSEDFQDWRMVCETVDGTEHCRMFQRLSVTQEGKSQALLLASIGFIDDEDGKRLPTLRLTTPLGVILPAGLAVNVDQGKPDDLPFHICLPEGCMTETGLSARGIADMKGGRSMHVTYRVAGLPQPVAIGLSLMGFTAAYEALEKREKGG